MGELESGADERMHQFSSSGRSGRRNALPEIDVSEVDPGAQKLAERFSQLDATDAPSTSKQSDS
ncbi:unnamed protein product, partial [Mesorhabditis belari]